MTTTLPEPSRTRTVRRLVAVELGRDVPSLVAHLGALAAGCPVLLLPRAGTPP